MADFDLTSFFYMHRAYLQRQIRICPPPGKDELMRICGKDWMEEA